LAGFIYNASKYKTMQVTPFKVDIGYVPQLPLNIIAATVPYNIPQTEGGQKKAESFAHILQDRI
jgi:hypothetical protein